MPAGGFTLWRKLKRGDAIIWNILHGSSAPFKFEKQRYIAGKYPANKSVKIEKDSQPAILFKDCEDYVNPYNALPDCYSSLVIL